MHCAADTFMRELVWYFRALGEPDKGIDAIVELSDAQHIPDGRLIALQVKGGISYFSRPRGDDGWMITIKRRHVVYWSEHSLSVVILIHDPTDNVIYWEPFVATSVETSPLGAPRLLVHKNNRLVAQARDRLTMIAEQSVSAAVRRRASGKIVLGVPDPSWIDAALADHVRLHIEMHDDNGASLLSLRMRTTGTEDDRVEWRYRLSSDPTRRKTELEQLFPWADISRASEDTRPEDAYEYVAQVGRWDAEDEDYAFATTFAQWLVPLNNSLAPYATSPDGDTSYFLLRLDPNDVGLGVLSAAEAEERAAVLGDDTELDPDPLRYGGRPGGDYEVEELDTHGGPTMLRCNYTLRDYSEPIATSAELFSGSMPSVDLACGVLEHAGEPLFHGLVEAFRSRFRVPGDQVTDWALSSEDLEAWLLEMRRERL